MYSHPECKTGRVASLSLGAHHSDYSSTGRKVLLSTTRLEMTLTTEKMTLATEEMTLATEKMALVAEEITLTTEKI